MAGGLCYSDEEPESRGVFKAARSAKRGGARRGGGPAPKRRKKVVQEFDTNVFEVGLACLANQRELATGDAEICKSCTGVFSKFSKLTMEEEQ